MAKLVLVGLPGVGKSTLAGTLAAAWGCDAIDTDDVIGERVGSSAASYLSTMGEAAFRERELDALREVLGLDAVIATGAGIVTIPEARTLLAGELTIWLDADDEIILERVRGGDRPLLGEDHRAAMVALRRDRETHYRSSSRRRVDASGSLDEVVARVLSGVQSVPS